MLQGALECEIELYLMERIDRIDARLRKQVGTKDYLSVWYIVTVAGPVEME
jgi:hypothetical protein